MANAVRDLVMEQRVNIDAVGALNPGLSDIQNIRQALLETHDREPILPVSAILCSLKSYRGRIPPRSLVAFLCEVLTDALANLPLDELEEDIREYWTNAAAKAEHRSLSELDDTRDYILLCLLTELEQESA